MALNINKGGVRLARETGLHVTTVCKLQQDGMLPDEIRAHARELFAKRMAGKDPRWPGKIPQALFGVDKAAGRGKQKAAAAPAPAAPMAAPAPASAPVAAPRAATPAPAPGTVAHMRARNGLLAAARAAASKMTLPFKVTKANANVDADTDADADSDIDADSSTTDYSYGDTGDDDVVNGIVESHVAADRRKAVALADERELKVAQIRGDLVPVVTVNAWFGRQIIECRDGMLKIPSELRDRLAAETDPVRIEDMLLRSITQVLDRLRQMEGVAV